MKEWLAHYPAGLWAAGQLGPKYGGRSDSTDRTTGDGIDG
jgi:hypothetical protein